jgi:threonine aldolase
MPATPREIKLRCAKILSGHRPRTGRQWFEALAASPHAALMPDEYGEGEAVQALEREIAALLGKPAATFMPKGIIAQQAALRVWADRCGCPVVALHPKCHIAFDERDAIERLHGLSLTRLGGDTVPFTAGDLAAAGEMFGAVTVELPLRRAGYKLPSWVELVAISDWCREQGVPLHLDGARLWESQPFYGRTLAEIADLGDSIYVSLYKGLGGLAGCVLAGPETFIAEARIWQTRHGGFLPTSFPEVVSALDGLRHHLPMMAGYVARAQAIAAALATVPGVRTVPAPPQTNGFQVYLPATPPALDAAHRAMAENKGHWLFGRFAPTGVPDLSMAEISVGEAAADWSDGEIAAAVAALIERARAG